MNESSIFFICFFSTCISLQLNRNTFIQYFTQAQFFLCAALSLVPFMGTNGASYERKSIKQKLITSGIRMNGHGHGGKKSTVCVCVLDKMNSASHLFCRFSQRLLLINVYLIRSHCHHNANIAMIKLFDMCGWLSWLYEPNFPWISIRFQQLGFCFYMQRLPYVWFSPKFSKSMEKANRQIDDKFPKLPHI